MINEKYITQIEIKIIFEKLKLLSSNISNYSIISYNYDFTTLTAQLSGYIISIYFDMNKYTCKSYKS